MATKNETSVIYVTYKEDADGKGYKETRSYNGNFGKIQLLRTIIGICNETLFSKKYNVEETLTDDDLEQLQNIIEALLNKGEKTNAN